MGLVWDKVGERTYETGISKCVLYPVQDGGAYNKGVAWSGISSISESPSGADSSAIYADNIKYLSLTAAEDFGGTITAFTYPEEFTECDGSAEIAEGVTIGQQTRKMFGLAYRTILGNDTKYEDHGYKLHLIYGAKASPSEASYSTVNDSPEAMEMSWEFTTTPVDVAGHKPTARLIIDSTKVAPEKLQKLEDILYGNDSDEPRLPLPDEILTLFAAG